MSIPASHFLKSAPAIKGDNLIRALQSKINDFFIAKNKSINPEKISRLQLDENTVDVRKTIWSNEEGISDLATKRVPLKPVEIEQKYERIIKGIYSPFSAMILQTLDAIVEELNIDSDEFCKYVLSNEDSYVTAIKSAIESIRDEEVHDYKYSIPESAAIGKTDPNANRYLYSASPVFHKTGQNKSPEEMMAEYLDNNQNVLFWFKNIERQPDAFCIAYDNRGGTEKNDNFYPDFIVMDKNKKLWILETKGGQDADIDKKTPEKYTGIQNYLMANKNSILKESGIDDFCFSVVRPLGNALKIFVGEVYKKSLSDSGWRDLAI